MAINILARYLSLMGITFFCVNYTAHARSNPTVSGEYIVKFKPRLASGVSVIGKAGFANVASANKIAVDRGARLVGTIGGKVQQKFEKAGLLHIDSINANQLEMLRANSEVEFIEPNYILSLDPDSLARSSAEASAGENRINGVAAQPTDYYSQSYAAVQVTESWGVQKDPASATRIVVAVIDTGLDTDHAVFKDSNAVWTNAAEVSGTPGVDDDGNGYVDDIRGWNFVANSAQMYDDNDHGTHVAGIVLGAGQDIFQVPVRESKIKIMPLKFLSGNGSGTTANAISALYYAVNNGAKVINNSWGGPSYSRSLHDAYKYAYDNDVLLVSAAGNDNLSLDATPMYPAAFDTPSNITVGSSTNFDRRSSFSNYSTGYVHIFAPGSSIMSTIPGSQCSDPQNLFYYCLTSLSGTSMATPFVAGVAALAMREASQLTAYQIRGVVLSAIDSSSYLTTFAQTGGRLNALKAMQLAQAQVTATAWSPTYNPVYKTESSSVSTPAEGSAGGCGLVKAIADEVTKGPPSSGQVGQILFMLALVLLPAFIARRLRSAQMKSSPVRKYERFQIAKDIMIQVGDQVIQSASQTLAVGGLSFKSDMQFAKGQKIKVKISDVSEEIDAEIVWSTESNSFGVKFLSITDSLKNQMQVWSLGLNPT